MILNIEDITAGYTGVDILHQVNFRVKAGEIVSIFGPNGAGKSTLLKTIFGLLQPRLGKVFLYDEDITGLKPEKIVRKGISYVPQVDNVFPSMTIQENLLHNKSRHLPGPPWRYFYRNPKAQKL